MQRRRALRELRRGGVHPPAYERIRLGEQNPQCGYARSIVGRSTSGTVVIDGAPLTIVKT